MAKKETMNEALDKFADAISIVIDGETFTKAEFAVIKDIQRKHNVDVRLAALMHGWWGGKCA